MRAARRQLTALALVAGAAGAAFVGADRGGADGGGADGGGTDGPGAGDTRAASHVRTVGCGSTVRGEIAPAGRDDLVVGPVLLRGALLHARRRRAEFEPRDGRHAVAKIGIVLQPGAEVVLSVHRRQRRHVGLAYTEDARAPDRVADGEPALRFRSCSDDRPSGWPGGFVLSGPRCARVELAIRGVRGKRSRRIEFGRGSC